MEDWRWIQMFQCWCFILSPTNTNGLPWFFLFKFTILGKPGPGESHLTPILDPLWTSSSIDFTSHSFLNTSLHPPSVAGIQANNFILLTWRITKGSSLVFLTGKIITLYTPYIEIPPYPNANVNHPLAQSPHFLHHKVKSLGMAHRNFEICPLLTSPVSCPQSCSLV